MAEYPYTQQIAMQYPPSFPLPHSTTHLLHSDVKVGFKGQSSFEPLPILLNEVEVHSTHQPLVLIQNVRLEREARL